MFKPKVLVTGGAGFIGSHQVDALVMAGYKVVVVDDLSSGSKSNVNAEAKFHQLDIREENKLRAVFEQEKPQFVFHFAAQMNVNRSVEDPVFDADVNIIGSLGLLDLCVEFGVKKVMFSSTGGALYGEAEMVPTPENYPCEPESPYGIAKLAVEKYIRFYSRQYGLEHGIMRYANVYGPRQNPKGEAGVISIFAQKLLARLQPIIHGDGHQTRDYVFVSDVINANMLSFTSPESDTYNIGTGRQSTVNEVFGHIRKSLASSIEAKHQDVFHGQNVSCLSSSKIVQALGWKPEVELAEGIEKTVKWFKSQSV
ncbi:NAD-dependent epimerase/dehydratase family protein [Candidatus Falkowbacteria bacterium]|jgi:UDP-glucose 4-epimerase|nr:NAD-dependent epimerase/dehydratase family protein [Candidatus Falkowbacteria bacterium]MBT5503646.1 NAD-dependent epimerase/dehydratase family protein [Candidatus Falkowbacteria bacterium]MBT6574110.1 NAD-dependent epimerase/dehydratase family protein [Candidatus Falkowbacteria bacterium]MBT7500684.1 NAD-dependent epimerase/dehydratase family protein [Candidatus Falkowbacteria bacterium]